MKRGVKTRIHPCYPTDDTGAQLGEPILQTQAYLDEKRKKMGPYVFACQMILNPKADDVSGFKEDWLRHYRGLEIEVTGNIYIVMDPANAKKKDSDYTAGWVVEACADQKVRIRDILRDRLNLMERTQWLMGMHRKYTKMGHKPLAVGYEKYGKDTDIDHIEYIQEQDTYQFDITPLGGAMAKEDRIRLLIPDFEQGNLLLPTEYNQVNYEGRREDLVQVFVDDEYLAFPIMDHDDMLDGLARIKDPDMDLTFPMPDDSAMPGDYDKFNQELPNSGSGGFMF
jgi:phage terminase large subunit-like protein